MKKGAEILRTGGEMFDPETGEQITFTESHLARLVAIEQRIATHYIQLSLDLKEIHDGRLYLLRGCNAFSEYCQTYLRMSARHAYNHLKIASTFSDAFLKKVTKSDMPMVKLLEISRSSELADAVNAGDVNIENGRVVYADGTEEDLDEYLSRNGLLPSEKGVKLSKKEKRILDEKEQEILELEDQVERLKLTIENIAREKDVDPAVFSVVCNRRQALTVIHEIQVEMLRGIGALDNLPRDLMDAELAGSFQVCVSAVEASLQRLKENWSEVVYLPLHNE